MENRVFEAKIKNVMTDNMYDRVIANKRKGKLDSNRLYKVATGAETVFKQKQERKGKHYNVVLLIDQSGSMHCDWGREDKIDLCADLTSYIAKVLDRNSVNIAIIGFNNEIREYKSFEKKIKTQAEVRKALIYDVKRGKDNKYGHSTLHCNHDYDALETAYKLLGKKKGTNLLMVFSDGRPSCDGGGYYCGNVYDQNKHQVSEIRKLINANRNVKTIGIGIDCREVAAIYDNHVVADEDSTKENFDQLFKVGIVNILKKEIKRQ